MSEEKETKLMVYAYMYQEGKGPQWHKWYNLDTINNNGSRLRNTVLSSGWKKNKGHGNIAPAQPGSIWEFDVHPEGGVVARTARYVEMWKNENQVTEWQLIHKTNTGIVKAKAKAAKEMKARLPKDVLYPFRKAYQNQNAAGKQQLLAYVMAEITKPY